MISGNPVMSRFLNANYRYGIAGMLSVGREIFGDEGKVSDLLLCPERFTLAVVEFLQQDLPEAQRRFVEWCWDERERWHCFYGEIKGDRLSHMSTHILQDRGIKSLTDLIITQCQYKIIHYKVLLANLTILK